MVPELRLERSSGNHEVTIEEEKQYRPWGHTKMVDGLPLGRNRRPGCLDLRVEEGAHCMTRLSLESENEGNKENHLLITYCLPDHAKSFVNSSFDHQMTPGG